MGRVHQTYRKAGALAMEQKQPAKPLSLSNSKTPSQSCPRQSSRRQVSLYSLLGLALLLRLLTSLLPHSGQFQAPTYGDFEAQRHWMELTTALPVSQWYFHDPSWWRLDYPPVTAYHSYILGRIGSLINPEWFELYTSRGCEELGLKVFMRASVLLSEVVLYVPAVLCAAWFISKAAGRKDGKKVMRDAVAAMFLQPAIILIDHGHFQYNSVMLGFFVAAVSSFFADLPLLGCGFFVAALGFKQMALFYAPAVAAYLAGTCLFPKMRIGSLVAIAGVTIASFGLLFAPLLLGTYHDIASGIELPAPTEGSENLISTLSFLPEEYMPYIGQIAQTIHRIFPFQRGIFEDKVANIWVSLHYSGLYKLATHHSAETLQAAALLATLLLILPPCLIIFFKPRKNLLLYALSACAWGFFLCSYQVHEKNVLLPLMPMTALLAGHRGQEAATKAWVGFANIVGTWSLYHLLIKDQLEIAYFPLVGIWLFVMNIPLFNFELYRVKGGLSWWERSMHLSAYAAIAIWHIVQWTIRTPEGKPDLWIVLNMICSCAAFCACYVWCLGRLVVESGLVADVRVMVKFYLRKEWIAFLW